MFYGCGSPRCRDTAPGDGFQRVSEEQTDPAVTSDEALIGAFLRGDVAAFEE